MPVPRFRGNDGKDESHNYSTFGFCCFGGSRFSQHLPAMMTPAANSSSNP